MARETEWLDPVDQYGQVIDVLLSARRDLAAAVRQQPGRGRPWTAESPAPADAGTERHRSAWTLAAGHAFVQNLRRGHYEIATEAPSRHRLRVVFNDLVPAI